MIVPNSGPTAGSFSSRLARPSDEPMAETKFTSSLRPPAIPLSASSCSGSVKHFAAAIVCSMLLPSGSSYLISN